MVGKNTPTLETERLRLRKFTKNDIDALFVIYKDDAMNTYLPWFPLKSHAEAAMLFAEKYAQAYRQPKGYHYAICQKEDDVPIGYIGVSMDDSHDLGYGIRTAFWHQGIATEAGKAVLAQIKSDGLAYVTATHDVENPRSGAVMKQLGMRYQYSYQEQWQPKDRLVTFRLYQFNFDSQSDRVFEKYRELYPSHFVENDV